MDEIKRQWSQMLGAMLNHYRRNNPEDERMDTELLESMMEHFCESGLVKKSRDGKWLVGRIKGSIPLIQ